MRPARFPGDAGNAGGDPVRGEGLPVPPLPGGLHHRGDRRIHESSLLDRQIQIVQGAQESSRPEVESEGAPLRAGGLHHKNRMSFLEKLWYLFFRLTTSR